MQTGILREIWLRKIKTKYKLFIHREGQRGSENILLSNESQNQTITQASWSHLICSTPSCISQLPAGNSKGKKLIKWNTNQKPQFSDSKDLWVYCDAAPSSRSWEDQQMKKNTFMELLVQGRQMAWGGSLALNVVSSVVKRRSRAGGKDKQNNFFLPRKSKFLGRCPKAGYSLPAWFSVTNLKPVPGPTLRCESLKAVLTMSSPSNLWSKRAQKTMVLEALMEHVQTGPSSSTFLTGSSDTF